MKTRLSHVTNSSSSSFVISRNDITKDKLIEILLEIANKEQKIHWDEEFHYDERDIRNNDEDKKYTWYRPKTVVAGRYCIAECTEENPYTDWNDYEYTNDFYIDNESCIRYDWDVIEDVLGKYGIPWRGGYCD